MEMKFYMPTKVLVGKDIILRNTEIFNNYGKKALIVTGRNSSKNNGSLKDVTEALERCNIQYMLFDKVEENPSLETIMEARNMGVEFGAEFIVGIGGGSPLDASKAIGVMIKNPELTIDTIFTDKKLSSIDIIAVPTTAGTGSETTQYSILTVHKEKTKKNLGQEIFAKVSFLDAKYMENMPAKTTISTAVDAFSHLAESYLNVNANIITDGLIEKALSIFGKAIPSLIKGEFSNDDRENLMMASTIAGMVIAQTGTSLPHGMGYALTYFKGLPHGLANGCLYIEYLNIFKDREKVNNIWKCLGLQSYEELIEVLDKLTVVEIDVTKEEIASYTEGMISNKAKLKNHPEEISYDDIFNIYYNSLI